MTDKKQLRRERADLFNNAVRATKKQKRVPIFSSCISWRVCDAGYKLSEALFDMNKLQDSIRYFLNRYPTDSNMELGVRNPLMLSKAVSGSNYVIDDENNSVSLKDACFIEPDEYDDLMKGYHSFLWRTVIPRRCTALQELPNGDTFQKAIYAMNDFSAGLASISNMVTEEFGIPLVASYGQGVGGYEELFNYLRGIKGCSIDMRRDWGKFTAVCDYIDSVNTNSFEDHPDAQFKGSNPDTAFDMSAVMLGHTILNTKQFERLMWPWLKKLGEDCEKYDKTCYIHVEGNSERFYDFFRELPDKRFCLLVEQNDVFNMKKALPNVTVAGGFPQHLLANGTKDECIDYARKLIEELAYDGRYVFSQNKMITFRNDCKSENLKAICDFVYNFEL